VTVTGAVVAIIASFATGATKVFAIADIAAAFAFVFVVTFVAAIYTYMRGTKSTVGTVAYKAQATFFGAWHTTVELTTVTAYRTFTASSADTFVAIFIRAENFATTGKERR